MVISTFYDKTLFLDTAPLIYYIEGSSLYQQHLHNLFILNDEGRFQFITSPITLLEVLVKPLKSDKPEIAEQYKTLLTSAKGITIIDMTASIAATAARLRASYSLHTPDSIQLATAIENNADYFLTNDQQLKTVPEIAVITLDDLRPEQ